MEQQENEEQGIAVPAVVLHEDRVTLADGRYLIFFECSIDWRKKDEAVQRAMRVNNEGVGA